MNDPTVEVIKEGEIMKMSESRALEEDLFILREVIEPDRHFFELPKRQDLKPVEKESKLEKWKKARISYKKNNVLESLKQNFHWDILRKRRARNMTRKQLADAIGVSEEDLKMIEMGDLPKDDFVLVSKIENFLGVDLRKEKQTGEVTLADLQKMNQDKIQASIRDVHMGNTGGESIYGDEIVLEE